MSEIRQNMATKEWVVIATRRARRPEEFVQPTREKTEELPAFDADCPFCPGNEELELEKLRLPAEGEWQLRVVRNKYPALEEIGPVVRCFDGVHRWIAGVGYHEVVIESRLHNVQPALQSAEEIERTLTALQMRGQAIRQDPRIQQVVYFKNHGPLAGTSLRHPHSQLVALPIVPSNIRDRIEEARRYYDDHGECAICRMRDEEERQGVRMVVAGEHFSAFIPYAAFSPFHLWIVPRRHGSSFLDVPTEEVRDLSHVLRRLLRKLYYGLNDPDYNYVIRSAPEREAANEYLHWYVSVIPRVTQTAGFEMGSGMFINTALPEESAAFLRAIEDPSWE